MSIKERLNSFKFKAGVYLALTLLAFLFLTLIAIVPVTAELISFNAWGWRVLFGLIGIAGVILTVRMGKTLLTRAHSMRRGVSLKNSKDGAIQMAKGAVETLIVQGMQGTPGISNVSHKVIDNEDSISIDLTMSASSKIDIPAAMRDLQRRVKTYVNATSGVNVRDVRVIVDKVIVDDDVSSPEAISKLVAAKLASEPEDDAPAADVPAYDAKTSAKSWRDKLKFSKESKPETSDDAPEAESADVEPVAKFPNWFDKARAQVKSGIDGVADKLGKNSKSNTEEAPEDEAPVDVDKQETPAVAESADVPEAEEVEKADTDDAVPSFADFVSKRSDADDASDKDK